jgi:hypothetical protein
VAGETLWANKDKMATSILDSGKILVTDEAFAKVCILNYWERWTSYKSLQWTDAHGGNTHFRGCNNDAYQRFNKICNIIKRQRKSKELKAMEEAFLEYAREQHSWGTKQGRFGIQNNGPELFNELADL